MKIAADRLATEALRLELPDGHGHVNVIALGRSGGVTGVYEQDRETIRLGKIGGEELQVTELRWHLPNGQLSTASPAKLSGVLIDAEIPLGKALGRSKFVGRIEVAAAEADALIGQLGGASVRVELDAERLSFAEADDGARTVEAARISLHDIQGEVEKLPLQIDEISLHGVSVRIAADGALALRAARAQLNRLVVHVGRVELKVDQLDFPRGVELVDDALSFGDLAVGEVLVSVDDFLAMVTNEAAQAAPEPVPVDEVAATAESAAEQARDAANREPFDLRLLDRLNGQIDLDLTADTTVPLIGRRKATHHFRIPIADGTINYRDLERDLAALEDAFIDINVRDGKLSLEKDIPLLPFYHKTLVYWHLSEDDHTLAKQRLVRLRTLFDWEIPEERRSEIEESAGDEKQSFAVRRLDFANIDVDLSLDKPSEIAAGGGVIKLGSLERAGIGKLSLDGNVRYDARAPAEPTELELQVKELNASLDSVRVGDVSLSATLLEVGAVDRIKLVFAGVQPKGLTAMITGVHATDAVIGLKPAG